MKKIMPKEILKTDQSINVEAMMFMGDTQQPYLDCGWKYYKI